MRDGRDGGWRLRQKEEKEWEEATLPLQQVNIFKYVIVGYLAGVASSSFACTILEFGAENLSGLQLTKIPKTIANL